MITLALAGVFHLKNYCFSANGRCHRTNVWAYVKKILKVNNISHVSLKRTEGLLLYIRVC